MMVRMAWLLCLLALPAFARGPDGTLDVILRPHNGLPAICAAGQAFEAVLTVKGSLRLAGERDVLLNPVWSELPGGRHRALCAIPEGVPPGTYALVAATLDGEDRNVRAVYVVEAHVDAYTFAHVTDTHVGSNRHARSSEAIFTDVIAAVNKSDAAFVLITGDVTENGEADQFQRFLEIMDTCALPTYVCSGNHDRKELNYERFLGALTYTFWYGRDGYLGFDTKDFNVADELGPQDGELQVLRRAIKPARWSIGFSHRYENDMGMRSQLVLFVDDPLDHFFYGHTHRANREGEKTVPWGTTPITITPAGINGSLRYVDVSITAIDPREPENVTSVE
jgi:predicted phosphodiesterase